MHFVSVGENVIWCLVHVA